MASTDYDAQGLVTSLGAERGAAGPIEAQALATDLGSVQAAPGPIDAAQLFGPGSEPTTYFKMRGLDSGAGLTTWVAEGAPDPDGLQATTANTTPPLTGSVIEGSGIILARWTSNSSD